MKILSVRNPWAALIIHGFKTVETRTHGAFVNQTGQRIGIHVSQAWSKPALFRAHNAIWKAIGHNQELLDFLLTHNFAGDLGKIIGSVYFDRCEHEADVSGRHDAAALCETHGRFCHFFKDLVVFDKPVEAKGCLYLWDHDLKRVS